MTGTQPPKAPLALLRDEAWQLPLSLLATPGSIHDYLERTEPVQCLRRGLDDGTFPESNLKELVTRLLSEVRIGQRSPDEAALAALAVVLERRPTTFSEEFLNGLASLQLAELSMAIRVARECLKCRRQTPTNRSQSWTLAEFPNDPARVQATMLLRRRNASTSLGDVALPAVDAGSTEYVERVA
jgi:hypothetical protein